MNNNMVKVILISSGYYLLEEYMQLNDTCELKVCTTKKPENPSVFLTLPVAHELSVLCMI